MNRKEFIKILEEKEIEYSIKDNILIINKNQGDVYLDSLTKLPEDTKFENQGNLYLNSLTSLPDGTKFENKGSVNLYSLDNKKINYLNKDFKIKIIDFITMLIDSNSKIIDGIKVTKAYYFKGGSLKDLPKSYIASKDDYTAHGETVKEAIEDLNFKILSTNFNIKDIVSKIKKSKIVSINDYRLLTGACRQGCKEFMKSNKFKGNEVSLEEVLKLTKNEFGGSRFKELIEG